MKPSKRIIEICEKHYRDKFIPEPIAQAIMHYLDEQYEQNKTLEERQSEISPPTASL